MTSDSTRWTVIQRAAQGSPADREEFVRRYGLVIRSYLGTRKPDEETGKLFTAIPELRSRCAAVVDTAWGRGSRRAWAGHPGPDIGEDRAGLW